MTAKSPDKKGKSDLQGVCLIDSIPGADDADGLVILTDGSMRRYVKCEGLNALLFDEDDRQLLARTFANFANTCETDVQIIVRSRTLPVDEFLTSSRSATKTENDYLNWYADYTDKWFRRVQDLHFIPLREFYVVVTNQIAGQPAHKDGNASLSSQQPNGLLDLHFRTYA